MTESVYYVDSVGYAAVTAWSNGAAKTVGNLVRQSAAPALGDERVFMCVVAGTTGGAEPSWDTTADGGTTDNTITWRECTGKPAVNGDTTNTRPYSTVANTFVSAGSIIKNNAATHLFMCTTGGATAAGSEPTWDTTTGNTTVSGSLTWTCIGAINAFAANSAPHARLGNAHNVNWATNDDRVFVKSSHAETGALGTITLRGTAGSPTKTFCHNGGAYPPLAANLTTGATVTNTSGSFTISGIGYVEGIEFVQTAADTLVLSSSGMSIFRNCRAKLTSASSSANILFGPAAGGNGMRIRLENFEAEFGNNAGQTIFLGQQTVEWHGGAVENTATTPGVLFSANVGNTKLTALGVDFSALDSGGDIVGTGSWQGSTLRFMNCLFSSSVDLTSAVNNQTPDITFVNCSVNGVVTDEYRTYQGLLTKETTVRMIGGASDGDTAHSWKVVTNTFPEPIIGPFECPPIRKYLKSADVGVAKTLTIEGIAAAVPNNDQVWVEVEYMDDPTSPQSAFVSDGLATPLSTAAAQDSSSQVWTGSTAPFKLSVSFTPMRQGWVTARVKIGKASDTFYINPQIGLS